MNMEEKLEFDLASAVLALGDARRVEEESKCADVIKCTRISTILGDMTACATDSGICLLEFDDSRRVPAQLQRLQKKTGATLQIGRHRHLSVLRQELKRYLAGKLREFSLPRAFSGTDFQCAVWKALVQVDYGRTINYPALAKAAGNPAAVRAAGAANGANPLSLLVPCHRVVGTGGSLIGYGGGIERKRWLLSLEAGRREPSIW